MLSLIVPRGSRNMGFSEAVLINGFLFVKNYYLENIAYVLKG